VAVLRIPDENRSLREHREVRDYLAGIGIDYDDGISGEPALGCFCGASPERLTASKSKNSSERVATSPRM